MIEGQMYSRVAADPTQDPRGSTEGSLASNYRCDPAEDSSKSNAKIQFASLLISMFTFACLIKVVFLNPPEPVQSFNDPADTTANLRGENLSFTRDESNSQCLSVSSLRTLIDATDQVFVTMPARGAGTSFQQFGDKCFGAGSLTSDAVRGGEDALKELMMQQYEVPKVITSHNGSAENMAKILHDIPKTSLVIYSHREETPRMLSAIKHVLATRYCGDKSIKSSLVEKMEGDECYVKEGELVNLVKEQSFEIGEGAGAALSCDVYDTIEEYGPTMLFMDYSNADEIQNLLAEKYCPDLVGKPVHATEETPPVFVHTENPINESGESIVSLDEWLEAKSTLLEFALRLNDKATCVGKTRKMEDSLLSCKDGYLSSNALLEW
mmetsp:Transcript_12329/g.21381  ORF Transcript_12329/g.21381 Transcript_12329/m.21381 type:complete len:381 (+) Transcript_12329:203-1345(+)|eukprot:CAMPEP_0183765956 /NCGR_PEP_ID=MMETSP0739-20130205/11252_1 /TAXON_ID=385413 /ORGANISM="Thalassiosira miniscula, Strain CCMP1093" /LENGTH=380 /DNA_ID=CAMNT_0026004685 /DNA_START=157 /DNA_END=1302 /DNA_ORIENTATION=-